MRGCLSSLVFGEKQTSPRCQGGHNKWWDIQWHYIQLPPLCPAEARPKQQHAEKAVPETASPVCEDCRR